MLQHGGQSQSIPEIRKKTNHHDSHNHPNMDSNPAPRRVLRPRNASNMSYSVSTSRETKRDRASVKITEEKRPRKTVPPNRVAQLAAKAARDIYTGRIIDGEKSTVKAACRLRGVSKRVYYHHNGTAEMKNVQDFLKMQKPKAVVNFSRSEDVVMEGSVPEDTAREQVNVDIKQSKLSPRKLIIVIKSKWRRY
jgi:hypothetical protein